MRSLMYGSPQFYTFSLRAIHGGDLDRRYREIAKIACHRRVFEVGCGPAFLGRYISRERYSGMDINKRFVRYAVKEGYDCMVGDIFKDEFPEADVGVAVDILHHITPREKELIERMRESFKEIIVIEPVCAFNVRLPDYLRKLWDSVFGDADGINPFENRQRWQFTEKELMEYMKEMGAIRTYTLGRDVVAIFKGRKHRDI